ncbi:CUE domain-containing protein 1 isoform X2 [Episyrphus balteatus]|uniref:CUE domain-containing protein 1 isoform X2 n=1 Tax=Episyrphus balteatus TaxID=286459 RepID=UPI0024864BFB|nr:CUE domain-containing protein 1 isoform X2 [Episyrphus balteatus]
MASTMQLEFAQAMSDFKTMFPDMDRDVIEAVLRANQGAVDATIDQLLAMSTDNQNEKLRNEMDKPLAATGDTPLVRSPPKTVVDSVQLIDTSDGSEQPLLNLLPPSQTMLAANTGASPKQKNTILRQQPPSQVGTPSKRNGQQRRWNPPILGPLPAGFLRIQSADRPAGEFDLPDEQFAMMLQNEEFMNELRWNQEFMTALEKEQQDKARGEDDAAFKERLKHMGKMSRKKFLQMARVFTWQRNKKVTSAKQIDSLPLKEEPSDDEDHHLQLKTH